MTTTDVSVSNKKESQIFSEVNRHYEVGFQETDRRATGKNRIGSISFNEADELFRSWLDENTWPYDALLFDPRVFTFIFEKTSRLIANKPKGKLIPREGSDIISAEINNALLSYQWDMANFGGTMLSKWSIMDINARKYGASFAICKWRYETDSKGKVVFDGPTMMVLNNRDIAHDLSHNSIESLNWFQSREYVTVQELKRVNDQASAAPIYKNLDKLKASISNKEEDANGDGGDSRSINWLSKNRSIAGLELDPIGKDPSFKTIEIVNEYRRDRWITFSPKHGVILRDIENPYDNYEIPITMLRYYSIDDDLYGISEIEPIKGIQKAINALLCQYVDEINQKLYSPIAIGPGVRQHTLEWGKGARWIMNNPMSDFRLVESKSNAAQYFNNTYSVLVSSMMNALGESSLGVSNVQPYQQNKTATEVKALQLQRNSRDQYNQVFLAEAIKRQYLLWHTMNQKLLFSDKSKTSYIFRIAGRDLLKKFQNFELDATELPSESVQLMAETNTEMPNAKQIEGAQIPKYPVTLGEKGKEEVVTKMRMEDNGQSALLAVQPDDLKGLFDFAVDVESMAVNTDEERKQARQAAISMLATNPNVIQLLMSDGVKPKFKDLFVTWLEDLGFTDAERFFEKSQPSGQESGGQDIGSILGALQGAPGRKPGVPTGNTGGIPGGTNPNAGGESQGQNPFSVNTETVEPEAIQQALG